MTGTLKSSLTLTAKDTRNCILSHDLGLASPAFDFLSCGNPNSRETSKIDAYLVVGRGTMLRFHDVSHVS
jgi:hypothetical protein